MINEWTSKTRWRNLALIFEDNAVLLIWIEIWIVVMISIRIPCEPCWLDEDSIGTGDCWDEPIDGSYTATLSVLIPSLSVALWMSPELMTTRQNKRSPWTFSTCGTIDVFCSSSDGLPEKAPSLRTGSSRLDYLLKGYRTESFIGLFDCGILRRNHHDRLNG